jgi:hypothetical protein
MKFRLVSRQAREGIPPMDECESLKERASFTTSVFAARGSEVRPGSQFSSVRSVMNGNPDLHHDPEGVEHPSGVARLWVLTATFKVAP